MITHEISVIIILLAMLILLPPIMKLMDFIGKKTGIYKKYFSMNGHRYGLDNKTKTPFGEFPVLLLEAVKTMVLLIALAFLSEILPEIAILYYIWITVVAGLGLYVLYLIGLFFNCPCLYCSTRRDNVETYIEVRSRKNQFFKYQITDIQYEDGWYMIFLKEPEEVKKSLLQHPNFHIRECPDRLRKMFSATYAILYLLPGILMALGIYYAGLKFFEIPTDILGFLIIIPVLPFYYRYVKEKDKLWNECEDQFREEENISKEKYRVNMRYEKDEGGRLIITVQEKSQDGHGHIKNKEEEKT